MPIIKRFNGDVHSPRIIESLQATIAQQQATIDYLAMMVDVDLPSTDEEVQDDE